MNSKYSHMVLDSKGGLVGEHATLAAAQKRVARLVAMSKGQSRASQYHILPWQKWTIELANSLPNV